MMETYVGNRLLSFLLCLLQLLCFTVSFILTVFVFFCLLLFFFLPFLFFDPFPFLPCFPVCFFFFFFDFFLEDDSLELSLLEDPDFSSSSSLPLSFILNISEKVFSSSWISSSSVSTKYCLRPANYRVKGWLTNISVSLLNIFEFGRSINCHAWQLRVLPHLSSQIRCGHLSLYHSICNLFCSKMFNQLNTSKPLPHTTRSALMFLYHFFPYNALLPISTRLQKVLIKCLLLGLALVRAEREMVR